MKTLKTLFLFLAVCIYSYAATINVPAGGSFQAALSQAQPGDTIQLTAGAVYSGQFKLPAQAAGTAAITITTDTPALLPVPGKRIAPGVNLPKIAAASGISAIVFAAGAQNYVLRGLEITVVNGGYAVDLVSLISPTPTVLSSYPANIVIDQCYIHGDAVKGGKRGIALNSASTTITNSYFSDFKSTNQDTQAIAGWGGPGPYVVANNFMQGGQAIMFGGAQPAITGMIPSNIQITHNYMTRPMSWKGVWPIKNQLELKNAQNVTIEDNVIENNWASAQNGYIVLFTVRTCEAGDHYWAVVKNVRFAHNLVRNSDLGVNILGTDNVRGTCPAPSVAGLTSDVSIKDNLFQAINSGFLQILSGAHNIVVDHNTVLQGGQIMGLDGTPPSSGFVFTNNVTMFGTYGVVGSGTIGALTTFAKYAPDTVFDRNVAVNLKATGYASTRYFPGDNFYPLTLAAAGVDSNDALLTTSTFKYDGLDGYDVGADVDVVLHATDSVVTGCDASLGCTQ